MPSAYEQRLIKRRAALAVLDLIPKPVAARFFATGPVGGVAGKAAAGIRTTDNPRASSIQPATTNSSLDVPPNGAGNTAAASSPKPPSPLPGAKDDIRIPHPDRARELQLRDIERTLDLFGDKYMNKHLLYRIVELVVVRLVPEMSERGVQELMEERIGKVAGIGAEVGG